MRIRLATATVGQDAGQFLNMLFGNTSLHEDVVLHDIEIARPRSRQCSAAHATASPACAQRLGVPHRAFTGSALKPQGLSPDELAALAERFAQGGLDFIKDDHGLADQDYSRFADRVRACAAASGGRQRNRTSDAIRPSLTGNLDQMRAQALLARDEGVDCVMLAPMISRLLTDPGAGGGLPGHGVFRPPQHGRAAGFHLNLLIGKLFPLIGSDAVMFPSHGGRFGYSPDICRHLAAQCSAVRSTDDTLPCRSQPAA